MKPQSHLAGSGTASGAGATQASLKTVERVRNVFPETWLWSRFTSGYILGHTVVCFPNNNPHTSYYSC